MATYDEIRFELDNLRAELEKACHEAENSILQVAGIGSTDIKVERTLPLVINICDLQVGDRITIPMGENVYTATAVDECDGEIYFLFDQLLDRRPIDSRDDFAGSFNDSELFAWLNSEFKEQLPAWVRTRLNHDITLPTVQQIFGTSDEWAIKFFDLNTFDYGEQFECMKDVKNRICTFEEDIRWYWLSTNKPSSASLAAVRDDGVAASGGAAGAICVRPLLKVRKR